MKESGVIVEELDLLGEEERKRLLAASITPSPAEAPASNKKDRCASYRNLGIF